MSKPFAMPFHRNPSVDWHHSICHFWWNCKKMIRNPINSWVDWHYSICIPWRDRMNWCCPWDVDENKLPVCNSNSHLFLVYSCASGFLLLCACLVFCDGIISGTMVGCHETFPLRHGCIGTNMTMILWCERNGLIVMFYRNNQRCDNVESEEYVFLTFQKCD